MNVALGLLGLALLGVDEGAKPNVPVIVYQLRIIEMEGLGWRESLYSRLQPVTRQGSATVWTAGHELTEKLVERAASVIQAPPVTALEKMATRLVQRSTRKVATQLTRHADGPVDHAVSVAYTPEYEEVGEGYQMTIGGRKLDQGVLTHVRVEDTRIAAVHQVNLTEVVPASKEKAAEQTLTPRLDVPEIVQGAVEGEWLIPRDGALVVSFGAHTTADAQGKAVIRERVMLLEAQPGSASVPMRNISFVLPPRPAPAEVARMPLPTMPTRSLPQGIAQDGTPVALPPLPPGESAPSTLPGTSDPCATPQAPHRPDPKALDPSSTKTSLPKSSECDSPASDVMKHEAPVPPPIPPKPIASAAAECNASRKDGMICTSGKPFSIHLPLNDAMMIEIRASIAPVQPH